MSWQTKLRPWLLWILFLFWLVVFFPKWYFITYTKVWELKQLVGASRDEQFIILHSSEMKTMVRIKNELERDSRVVLIVPPTGAFPQISIVGLWRALLGGSTRLRAVTVVQPTDAIALYPVPSKTSATWSPSSWICERHGCECYSWPVKEIRYWEVP